MKLFEIQQDAFSIYKSNLEKAKEGLDLNEFINQRKACKVENSIGHVYIYGTLLRDASPIEKKLGNTDYADVQEDLETVIRDGARAIVLHVDSGGGMVAGAIETAEIIQALPVPIVAHVAGACCSAAYKLASGCSWIVATKSSDVGNIGSIMVWTDSSEAMKQLGLSVTAFVNQGAIYKSTGHLDSLTDDQSTFLQESIDEAGTSFKNHVLSNRPNLNEVVFNAGWYSGTKALELGLIDEIGNDKLALNRASELAGLFMPEMIQE